MAGCLAGLWGCQREPDAPLQFGDPLPLPGAADSEGDASGRTDDVGPPDAGERGDGGWGGAEAWPDPALHEATEARCTNGIDDDGDGQIDCEDRHCLLSPAVTGCPEVEASDAACSDRIDNDGNGYADCRDFNCSRNPWVSVCGTESNDVLCSDGLDNDDNRFTDCADQGCARSDLVSVCAGDEAGFCLDGADNDGDGLVDCADPDCAALPCGEGQVAVVTWNVRRFFDTRCDSGRCGPGDFEAVASEAAFGARADQIVDGLERVGADVLVLQEIENRVALDALLERLDSAFRIAWIGEIGSPGSVDVAVIARGTLIETRQHRQTEIPLPGGGMTIFTRELLEVHLQIGGARVVVFAAHFRSKVDDDPDRRLAEARAAHDLVLATARELPGALVMLAGDLNDTPGSAALEALEADGLLLRVGADLPRSEAWTYQFRDQRRFLDHILLAAPASGIYVPRSARVHRDNRGYRGSDHAALVARFELP